MVRLASVTVALTTASAVLGLSVPTHAMRGGDDDGRCSHSVNQERNYPGTYPTKTEKPNLGSTIIILPAEVPVAALLRFLPDFFCSVADAGKRLTQTIVPVYDEPKDIILVR